MKRAIAHGLFWLSQARGYARFKRQLRHPRATQEAVLRRILQRNAGCQFGRAHGFAGMKSPAEFQARVPLSAYHDAEAAIGRMRGGEADVLFRGRADLFEPSGGSTSGGRLIPYNGALQREFQAGLAPWIFDLHRRYPALRGGSAYWSISPPGALKKEQVGFASDADYFGSLAARWAAAIQAVPSSVAGIEDPEAFRLKTLQCLIQAADLRFISVWNPSFLTLLLRDLAKLTPKSPRQLWPDLSLISCWADAHAASALPQLQALFPGVEIQPKSLLATEAIVTLPFEGAYPLSIGSHFFEFIDGEGRARCAWELGEGGVYSVVVTTGGGLYRYRLHDRVQVTGSLHDTPCLRFLGKEDCVSDLCGEKLEEAFVAAALKKLYAELRMEPAFSLVTPAAANAYALHIEGPVPPGLAAALEGELRQNFHYDHCRRLGQLEALQVRALAPGASGRYLKAKAARGLQLGALKALALDPQPWQEVVEA